MTVPNFGVGAASAAQLNVLVAAVNATTTALAAGKELGYAQITAASSAFTTIVDIGGLSVSFTIAATRTVLISVFAIVQSSVTADHIQLTLADGAGTQVQVTGDILIPTATNSVPAVMSWRASLAPGAYTYKVRANRQTGTGTCIVNAAATRPAFIQALDVT